MEIDVQKLANEILNFTKAKSVFLYGSRARGDYLEDSDYEIGVLIEKDKYIGRSEIKEKFGIKGVSIFPFCYEDFIAGNPDTPFVKSIYLMDVISSGKTLAGEDVIKNLPLLQITLLDVIQDVGFNLGYALAATHSFRNGDNTTATLHFIKSCLFGTRDYAMFKKQKYSVAYDDIAAEAESLGLGTYSDLPVIANKLRKGEVALDEKSLFKNISYLNQLIEREASEVY